MSGLEKVSIKPLSIWDQSTSRFYIRLVLCFAVENSKREQVASHLGATLSHLSSLRPDLGGRLHLGDRLGWVYLRESSWSEIPFEVFNIEDEFGYTYEELKAKSYPSKAFVHSRFGYNMPIDGPKSGAPVAAVNAFFIDGGMILAPFLHHTFGDGQCLLEFLEAFAAQSRGVHVEATGSRSLEFARSKRNDGTVASEKARSFQQLLQNCQEFVETDQTLGPNQPTLRPGGRPDKDYAKDGRVFVFGAAAIQGLKDVVSKHAPGARPPSSYVVIASLIWAHAAKARLQTERHEETWGAADVATMTNPVNWRKRAFVEQNAGYHGNAAALAQTTVAVEELRRACEDKGAWARLVREVERGIRRVDDEYVRNRIELIDRADDPRRLGLLMDPRVPQDLAFNTWRDFGADTVWDLGVGGEEVVTTTVENGDGAGPGLGGGGGGGGGVRPDKLRKTQDEWNMGGTLILPARKEEGNYEVLLTLPTAAMDILRRNKRFMGWVVEVLE